MLRRERNDGLYRVITYLCAKMLDELLVAILASFVFSVMVFYGVRFQGSLLLFWLVYLTTLSIGVGAPHAYVVWALCCPPTTKGSPSLSQKSTHTASAVLCYLQQSQGVIHVLLGPSLVHGMQSMHA